MAGLSRGMRPKRSESLPRIGNVYAHIIRQHAAGVADTFAAAVDQPDEDDPPAAALVPRSKAVTKPARA